MPPSEGRAAKLDWDGQDRPHLGLISSSPSRGDERAPAIPDNLDADANEDEGGNSHEHIAAPLAQDSDGL